MDPAPRRGPGRRAAAPLRRALDEQGFDPIPRPGPHDWLASHPEPGQTFAAFLAGHPPSPGPARRALNLQPFGPFDTGQGRRLIC